MYPTSFDDYLVNTKCATYYVAYTYICAVHSAFVSFLSYTQGWAQLPKLEY